ncbi:MAG: DUF1211 domain-containing protein [Candidatus Margulisbacteria bacterium]|nr:DUF1211 domain-containing protein [Candidatus Margulisiibacteriota bacterium]MBU1617504.1 DUF1211 domain-containing protein [Candidatus Margulisiibacteriota bacterium]MBU1867249.1 DUF1211 domain-containing protein [Candidatus Margulisiibacteriota bacterium]
MAKNLQERVVWLRTNRIEGLSDGIFAFSMTLLVMTLNLPEAGKNLVSGNLGQLLIGQSDKFFNYALSFILIAIVWMIHHQQFHFIKKTDQRHLWINIYLLMFVALIPFSTTLVGDYAKSTAAELFFDLNLFLVGVALFLNWEYSTRGYRLVNKTLPQERIVLGWRRTLVMPLVALLAMSLVYFDPNYSSYAYLTIPFILAFPYFKNRRDQQ